MTRASDSLRPRRWSTTRSETTRTQHKRLRPTDFRGAEALSCQSVSTSFTNLTSSAAHGPSVPSSPQLKSTCLESGLVCSQKLSFSTLPSPPTGVISRRVRRTAAGPSQTGSRSPRRRRDARCCRGSPRPARVRSRRELRRRSRSVEHDDTHDFVGEHLGVVGHDHSSERAPEQHPAGHEPPAAVSNASASRDDIVCVPFLVRCGIAPSGPRPVVGAHPRDLGELADEVRAGPFLDVRRTGLEEHGGLSLAPADQCVLPPVGGDRKRFVDGGFLGRVDMMAKDWWFPEDRRSNKPRRTP